MIQATHILILNIRPLLELFSVGDIAEKKNHNIMMIDIASTLSYAKFDEVKDYKTVFKMWNKLQDIYGGDDNVKEPK